MIPALPVCEMILPQMVRLPPLAQMPRAGVRLMMLSVMMMRLFRGCRFHGSGPW